MSVLYDFRCLSRGRLVDFLGSPAPEAFAGRHGAVGDFEDRVARAWTEHDLLAGDLLDSKLGRNLGAERIWLSDSDRLPIAGKQMDILGIECEANRIRMPISLKAVDAHGEPIPSGCRPMDVCHVSQIFDNLDKQRTDSATRFTNLQMFRPQPQG